MTVVDISHGISLPDHWANDLEEVFTPDLLKLLSELYYQLAQERQNLLLDRKVRQEEWNLGKVPEFSDSDSEAVKGEWSISPLPPELLVRRVEITGPAHSAKMVINMLSRNDFGERADMAMLDFEDSMKPSFTNVISGYKNVIGAVYGNLTYSSGDKFYRLDPKDSAYIMVRVRGLHLEESNVRINDQAYPAGLLDLAVCVFHTAKKIISQNKTPKYYVPKCEHFLEARWWNKVFTFLENYLEVPVGKIKATFLIETLPAAFQVEEILYEIREHAAGLNVGRWDKIFSDIKVLRNHPDRVLGDRISINMIRPWMENYAKRVIKICHNRGAIAMGGMSAFTPGHSKELRFEQEAKVREDKLREAAWGHDGCWVSHPYFIGMAMSCFPNKNQLNQVLPDFDKYSDILPRGNGPYTMSGLITNIRVGIVYLQGWNQDIGCVSFDNLMEDLATLEISRAQVWQWIHHKILLDTGSIVTKELVEKLFDQELAHLQGEFSVDQQASLSIAATEAKELFTQTDLKDFLTLKNDRV